MVPLTVLPVTSTDAGHSAPAPSLPQLAVTAPMEAGTASLKMVPPASDGPALLIVSV